MPETFQLPGAAAFSCYLQATNQGEFETKGPEDRRDRKVWVVRLNGEQIGVYSAFEPAHGDSDFKRVYTGTIPDYVNETLERTKNSCDPDVRNSVKDLPSNMVELRYEKGGRRDGHGSIPFP